MQQQWERSEIAETKIISPSYSQGLKDAQIAMESQNTLTTYSYIVGDLRTIGRIPKKKFRLVVVPEILVQRMLACQEDQDRGSNRVLVAKNEVERKVTKLSKKGYKRYITKRLKSIVDLTFSTYRFYIFRRC